MAETLSLFFFLMQILPNAKAAKALKQASSEATGAIEDSYLTR
jgi:hypothetical protein